MTAPPVSVIVVSRHRPNDLLRCIASLCQQDHPQIEIVIVADPASASLVRGLGLPLKLMEFDVANISAARNAGLAAASGDVAAFIDDDAAAEPTWVRRLAEPFADPRVMQSGGYVIGRNGFSYQWRALKVDATGQDHPFVVQQGASLHSGTPLLAVKTQGTNCAFRRAALLRIGGFSPLFRFYLDEADVNLRLAAAEGLTAVVTNAVVHHAFSASANRRADRTPLTLHEIGASSAVFLRMHAPQEIDLALDRLCHAQRSRLIRMMVEGRIEPREVTPLLSTLDAGIADGRSRQIAPMQLLPSYQSEFLPFAGSGPRPGLVLSARPETKGRVKEAALQARAAGQIVTVIELSRGPRRHRMRFTRDGIWWQAGGQFGASERTDPIFSPWRFEDRVAREASRLSGLRPI
ncbi:MAG: glycosyl transferase [Cereibacter sphaeroides]|uniref:Glycosyl transferase n=1 Tax=Cereibacter sphaeroides TaxID=1063 RepID=A0A2W5S442_CERSP|nr:MAG: glycosyl transferase [Cereibacter sphaeroides]